MGRSISWHNEQPDEEMYRASPRSALNAGASVPWSWNVSPFGTWMCLPIWKLPELHIVGILWRLPHIGMVNFSFFVCIFYFKIKFISITMVNKTIYISGVNSLWY